MGNLKESHQMLPYIDSTNLDLKTPKRKVFGSLDFQIVDYLWHGQFSTNIALGIRCHFHYF
ncbi:hypothetical protein ACE6H2_003804 [Prunus campanulata]